MSYQFLANIIIKGKIVVLTGLHIGGSKDKLEIGGVDSPVIRDPVSNFPYIPGSSLKGKMRMSLEFAEGKIRVENDSDGNTIAPPYESDDINDNICRIFGNFKKGTAGGPTRLLVRDSYPDEETIEMWNTLDSELMYTEYKPENTIDRLTSEANPRFTERVVQDSKFNLDMVYGVYDFNDGGKTDIENFKDVIKTLRILEHSALGGSISRGYGKINFHIKEPMIVKRIDYVEGSKNYLNASKKLSKEDKLEPLYSDKLVLNISESDL